MSAYTETPSDSIIQFQRVKAGEKWERPNGALIIWNAEDSKCTFYVSMWSQSAHGHVVVGAVQERQMGDWMFMSQHQFAFTIADSPMDAIANYMTGTYPD